VSLSFGHDGGDAHRPLPKDDSCAGRRHPSWSRASSSARAGRSRSRPTPPTPRRSHPNVGGRLAVGDWELGSGKYYGSFGANTGIERFAVSPDGTLGASVSVDAKTMHIRNLPGGENRMSVPLRPAGNSSKFSPFVMLSADGKSVYTAVEDSLPRVSVEKGTDEVLLAGVNTSNVAYSPARKELAEYWYSGKNPDRVRGPRLRPDRGRPAQDLPRAGRAQLRRRERDRHLRER